jgi:hypothetical protein
VHKRRKRMGRKVVDLVEVVEGEALASAGGEEEGVVLECQQRPIGHCMLRHSWSPALTWLPLRLSPLRLVESVRFGGF